MAGLTGRLKVSYIADIKNPPFYRRVCGLTSLGLRYFDSVADNDFFIVPCALNPII